MSGSTFLERLEFWYSSCHTLPHSKDSILGRFKSCYNFSGIFSLKNIKIAINNLSTLYHQSWIPFVKTMEEIKTIIHFSPSPWKDRWHSWPWPVWPSLGRHSMAESPGYQWMEAGHQAALKRNGNKRFRKQMTLTWEYMNEKKVIHNAFLNKLKFQLFLLLLQVFFLIIGQLQIIDKKK